MSRTTMELSDNEVQLIEDFRESHKKRIGFERGIRSAQEVCRQWARECDERPGGSSGTGYLNLAESIGKIKNPYGVEIT